MLLEFEILNLTFEIGLRLKGIAEDRTCLALELICTESSPVETSHKFQFPICPLPAFEDKMPKNVSIF